MSTTTLTLPASSSIAAKLRSAASAIAAAMTQSADVWRLYRLVGNADSLSPAVIENLAKRARAQ